MGLSRQKMSDKYCKSSSEQSSMSDSTNHFKISLAQRQTIITESGLCTGQINILVYLDKNIILHNIFE